MFRFSCTLYNLIRNTCFYNFLEYVIMISVETLCLILACVHCYFLYFCVSENLDSEIIRNIYLFVGSIGIDTLLRSGL